MTPLPVRKDHDARSRLPDNACDLQPIFMGVLDAAIGDIERISPTGLQNARGVGSFAGAVICRSTGAHLATREVEDGGAIAALRHLEQRATAGLFDVIAVRGDGQNVN